MTTTDPRPECDRCGYRNDGSGIRAVRDVDDHILCDFCAIAAERADR